MAARVQPIADPFLDELDALQAGLSRLRDEYVRATARRHEVLTELHHAATRGVLGNKITAAQVARRLHISKPSLYAGGAGAACVQARGQKINGRWLYDAWRVDLHECNALEGRECDCDKAEQPGPRRI